MQLGASTTRFMSASREFPVPAGLPGEIVGEQAAVSEKLLGRLALVTQPEHEFTKAEVGAALHDVSKDRVFPNRRHGLGTESLFFLHAGAHAAAQDDLIHHALPMFLRSAPGTSREYSTGFPGLEDKRCARHYQKTM
jgi:hypothetical protein